MITYTFKELPSSYYKYINLIGNLRQDSKELNILIKTIEEQTN